MGNESKIKNLENTIRCSTEKLMKSRAREPWRPTKSGSIEPDTSMLDKKLGRKRAKSVKPDILERDLEREDFASSFEGI